MFGLDVDTLRDLRSIFAQYPRIEKVLLYGSRAMGNYKNGSDIDITLIGENLTYKNTLNPLTNELDEHNTPYGFDVSIFEHLDSQDIVSHILRVGKTFYTRERREKIAGWVEIPLPQCLNRVSIPRTIPRKQFERSGRFPIVSQERDFINGYWSDEADVVHVDSPLVVFGDHTRTLKYIDFDFVVGADGVQLLQPKSFLYPKYFYYFLLWHPVNSLGYARHFKRLKELNVVFPESIPEQKQTVAILDQSFAAIDTVTDNTQKTITNARELLESQLERVFTGDATMMSKFPTALLGNSIVENPKSPIKVRDSLDSGSVIFFTSGVKTRFMNTPLCDGENLFLATGGRALVSHHKGPASYSADCYSIKGNNPIATKYLYYFLLQRLGYINDVLFKGAALKHLQKPEFKQLPTPVPPRTVQKQIVATLDQFFESSDTLTRINEQKLALLTDLKQSLLQKAFAGTLTGT